MEVSFKRKTTRRKSDGSFCRYILHSKLCKLLYSELEDSSRKSNAYAGRRVPKYVSSAEGNTRTLTLSSRPLLIPNNKNDPPDSSLHRVSADFHKPSSAH